VSTEEMAEKVSGRGFALACGSPTAMSVCTEEDTNVGKALGVVLTDWMVERASVRLDGLTGAVSLDLMVDSASGRSAGSIGLVSTALIDERVSLCGTGSMGTV